MTPGLSPRLFFDPGATDSLLRRAFELVGNDVGVFPATSQAQVNFDAQLRGTGPEFRQTGPSCSVRGATVPQVLRAIASWRGHDRLGGAPARHAETCAFDTLGVMIDVSRNAVPTVQTLKFLLRRFALMGLNQLLLYMEDTFEVPKYPHFGYLRGRYSRTELRDIDQYAQGLGIEVVPCVQTLGHLQQVLQWHAFQHVKDTDAVLLVDEPATYEFIEEIVRSASEPFATKSIHVGMDEVDGLGRGRYLDLHGYQSRFELLNRHLHQVAAICAKHNLRPMIWSDMYFRIASKRHEYYDRQSAIPSDLARQIPESVELVYWDYYHLNESFYEEWIDRHRAMNKEPIFASGMWTWGTFWQNYDQVWASVAPGMRACKRKGVRRAFATIWCDDGGEVDLRSSLPGVQYFAEHAYAHTVSDDSLRNGFWGSTGGVWDEWLAYGRIDHTPGGNAPTQDESEDAFVMPRNPCKFLLWQDPLLGLFDYHIEGMEIAAYYEELAEQLDQHRQGERDNRNDAGKMIHLLAKTLSRKAEFSIGLRKAYACKNHDRLRELVYTDLPLLIKDVERLQEAHRQLWHDLYKPFGWETLDRRYGGLMARLRAVEPRVRPFLEGTQSRIEELDEPRLPARPWPPGEIGFADQFRHIVSASVIM